MLTKNFYFKNKVLFETFQLSKIFFLLSIFVLGFSNSTANTIYTMEIWKNGGSGVWWNPNSWGKGYYSVNDVSYNFWENGNLIYKHKVECYGNGVNQTPEKKDIKFYEIPEWVPSEKYLNDSFRMMNHFVYRQYSNKKFKCKTTFNEIINNKNIYREVSWEIHSNSVQMLMKIYSDK